MDPSASSKLGTALCLSALLAACGGGGGSNGGPATTSTTTASTSTTTLPSAPPALSGGAIITGIAATGSPLLGASISVVDATGAGISLADAAGKAVTSATTSLSDGSYRLLLGQSATLPLMLQAAGLDVAGNPVLLHSLVASSTAPLVANITPASDAVVAMLVGGNPLAVFQNATSNSIALLGSAAAVSAASDLVKAIIAVNLTDGKITSSKTLDLFQDAAFSTNKSGLDAALEGLRIQVAKDANGKDQLQFSNKFLAAGTTEVKVDLATARAELAKGGSGSVAKAIVSTAKTTTSATSSLANLATLDNLALAINTLIAQGATPDFTSVLGSYTVHFGFDQAAIAARLTGYAAKNYQLGKFQVTGCADDTLGSKGCTRLLVSAMVTSSSGQIVDVLSDAVAYSKTTTPNWTFVGNNALNNFSVFPVAVATYGLDGTLATGTKPNPNSGVQALVVSQSSDPQKGIGRVVQTPSGYIIPFAECGSNDQCVSTNPALIPVATGELRDTLLDQSSVGWIGGKDAVSGAKYLVSFVQLFTGTNVPLSAYLSTDVPTDFSAAPFPRLDNVSSGRPLTPSAIVAGPSLSWATWAAANPNMRIVLVRSIVSAGTGAPLIQDAAMPQVAVSSVRLPPAVPPSGFVPVSYQIWLGAQDNLGRRYYSKYTSAP